MDQATFVARIAEGLDHHRAGRLAEAESVYRELLVEDPHNPDLGHLLGVVAYQVGQFDLARILIDAAIAINPDIFEYHNNLSNVLVAQDDLPAAAAASRRALALLPDSSDAWDNLVGILYKQRAYGAAERALRRVERLDPSAPAIRRSAVIAVLDETSRHSPWNIGTLLDDLRDFDGEVICVFNDPAVGAKWRDHPRIDKWSINKHNVGVARAWNIGLAQAEGEVIFILNADLHIEPAALAAMEDGLRALPDALVCGVEGEWYDPDTLVLQRSEQGSALTAPREAARLSGYCFALHAGRLHDCGLSFDPRLSPYFYEETDIAEKARARGLKAYVVPATGYHHAYGISVNTRPLYCMGRLVRRNRHMLRNHLLMRDKLARPGRAPVPR